MARPTGSDGVQTRERILDIALELFTTQGYDTTSLRDISARLGITKAALYYYFPRKEDILLELHKRLHFFATQMADEIETAPDGPDRVAMWPEVANRMVDFMIDNRDLMLLHHRNFTALAKLHATRGDELPDIDSRMNGIVASPAISPRDRVRMAAVVGAVTEIFVEQADSFPDIAPQELAGLVRETLADVLGVPVGAGRPAPVNAG
jgi:AcrR family transcriptional regulator